MADGGIGGVVGFKIKIKGVGVRPALSDLSLVVML